MNLTRSNGSKSPVSQAFNQLSFVFFPIDKPQGKIVHLSSPPPLCSRNTTVNIWFHLLYSYHRMDENNSTELFHSRFNGFSNNCLSSEWLSRFKRVWSEQLDRLLKRLVSGLSVCLSVLLLHMSESIGDANENEWLCALTLEPLNPLSYRVSRLLNYAERWGDHPRGGIERAPWLFARK